MSAKEPTAAELAEKLDSIRPDGTTDRPLRQEDVTGVMDLVMSRLKEVQTTSLAALKASTDRLVNEADRTCEVAQRVSAPPPEEKK